MFKLSSSPIITKLPQINYHAGGVVIFEGRVRALNEGKKVASLEYEAYPALAVNEGKKIVAEAAREFKLYNARAIHRTGHLQIGDVAVWVYTAATHRGESFKATEYIINEIKHRVPIWKKEYYKDGSAEWVQCHHSHA